MLEPAATCTYFAPSSSGGDIALTNHCRPLLECGRRCEEARCDPHPRRPAPCAILRQGQVALAIAILAHRDGQAIV